MADQQALIIDDNELNVEILTMLLEQAGLSAISTFTPRQLPTLLEQLSQIRVVFLDLELPNYDGFALHKELRADERLKGVPIIAYTVHTSEIDRVRRAGFDGFLGKPLRPESFGAQLARILAGQPVWEA